MPELPEVETVVRDLRPLLVGRKLTGLRVGAKTLRKRWSKKWDAAIVDRTVQRLDRRGKWILIDLAEPWLVIHLGMTGQLTVAPASEPLRNHTHLVFTLDDGAHQLRFRDVRRFGSATLFADRAALDRQFEQAGLGPEPFDVVPAYWRAILAKTSRCLKAILLDQRVLAGVGNIYADEALFEARLHPARLGCELESGELERLRKAIAKVLRRAIEKRGATIRDYIGGSGLKGKFQEEFRVYGRTDQPCLRCRTPIVRLVLAGRSTHVCPNCQ